MKFWIWALFLLFYQGKIIALLFKKFHRSIKLMMDSTLNRPLSKKIVRDSRFYYCIRITYQGEHYGHVWFWEGSTPLGVAAT